MTYVSTHPPPLPGQRSRRNWLLAVIVLAVLLGISLCVNLGLMVARQVRTADLGRARGGLDEYPRLIERWSYGRGEVKAARIALHGVIIRHEQVGLLGGSVDKVRDIRQQILAATHDEDVRCIVLEVDSPGGGITPSDEIYQALMQFKASREDRTVVAFTRDMAASGGYYAALAADWIIAEPTSIVGSIGVIMQSLNWKQLTDDIGIHDVTIKSGDNKDMLNPFRETSAQEIGLLQGMIDAMHARFKGIVAERRSLGHDVLDELADGRIFTADQALDHGLIDQVGYWEDVVTRTGELLGVEGVRFVRYGRQPDLLTLLTQARLPWSPGSLLDWQQPRMMFLWRP